MASHRRDVNHISVTSHFKSILGAFLSLSKLYTPYKSYYVISCTLFKGVRKGVLHLLYFAKCHFLISSVILTLAQRIINLIKQLDIHIVRHPYLLRKYRALYTLKYNCSEFTIAEAFSDISQHYRFRLSSDMQHHGYA